MHSVTLEHAKCIGCTDCIKRCPTEAIRVRDSKAQIVEERCIACGNCIRICRNGAKKAATDSLEMIKQFKYRVALPAPSFYVQFPKAKSIEWILEALLHIGFTDYFEVAVAAEIISEATEKYLKTATQFPIISSSCPAIVKLIQMRFPSLIPNILPIISPMELAARFIKEDYAKRGIDPKEVGVFFISPCPAKMMEVNYPTGIDKSMVDGVLSMQDLYKSMRHLVGKVEPTRIKQSAYRGLKWATPTGGMDEKTMKNCMSVDGIENVINILEMVEDDTLDNIQYIEVMACTGGCLGGALTIENPYVSHTVLKKWLKVAEEEDNLVATNEVLDKIRTLPVYFNNEVMEMSSLSLNQDRFKAFEMMERIEELYKQLPQIDCGSCGAPTCRCFAEDVVRNEVSIEACIFMLRKKIKELSDEMHSLAYTVIPTESNKKNSQNNI